MRARVHIHISLDRFGEVLGDTEVELKEGGKVIGHILGKASGYGACPRSRETAEEHLLRKSVLKVHGDYEAADELLPSDGCHPIQPVLGGAVWVLRGACSFINKTLSAAEAGASAVLIANAGKRKTSDTGFVVL